MEGAIQDRTVLNHEPAATSLFGASGGHNSASPQDGEGGVANRRPWHGEESLWDGVAEAGRELTTRQPLPVSVSKAGQLEAETLDQELTDMLKDQLRRVCSLLRPSVYCPSLISSSS